MRNKNLAKIWKIWYEQIQARKSKLATKKKQQTKMNVKKLEQENKIGYKNP
jgi:hypothetical protein